MATPLGTNYTSVTIAGGWRQKDMGSAKRCVRWTRGNFGAPADTLSKAYSIVGSNDQTTWYLLDRVSNQNTTGINRTVDVSYSKYAYRYYRWIEEEMRQQPTADAILNHWFGMFDEKNEQLTTDGSYTTSGDNYDGSNAFIIDSFSGGIGPSNYFNFARNSNYNYLGTGAYTGSTTTLVYDPTLSTIGGTTPDAPTSLVATPGNGSLSISFTPGSDGGSAITNYRYSLDGGSTFTAFSPAQTSSPVSITGLPIGTSYTIQLKAENTNGLSAAEVSDPPITATLDNVLGEWMQFDLGSAKVIQTYGLGNWGMDKEIGSWTIAGSNDTTTWYTIDTQTQVTPAHYAFSNYTSTGPAAASSFRYVRLIVQGLLQQPYFYGSTLQFVFYLRDASGNYLQTSSINTATYSQNLGNTTGLFYMSTTNDINGSYTLINSPGGGPSQPGYYYGTNNAYTGTISTPASAPSTPTSLSATPGNGSISISFAEPVQNGGATITNYKYSTSTDGGSTFTAFTAFDPVDTTSPVTITGLTNGTSYIIRLKAVNSAGDSAESASSNSATPIAPVTAPPAPTSLVATPGNATISISFTQSSDGGSAITNYLYSLNGGSFTAFDPVDTTSPVIITTGLTNGTSYTIRLKAVNSAGDSDESDPITATPSTAPSAPTSLVATPENTSVSVSFTPGVDGGYPITNYQYSLNGGSFTAFSPAQPDSPVSITGLINGTPYTIRLKAVDSQLVESAVSASSNSAIPRTVPDAPTSLYSTPGNGSLSIGFDQGSNGGSPITNYLYSTSTDGSTFTAFTAFNPVDTTSPVTITTGLTNGTEYTIQLKALNSAGESAASASTTGIPVTNPDAPTLLSATTGDKSVTISFTQGSNGGASISNYLYTWDGGLNLAAIDPVDTTSPVTILYLESDQFPLENGVSYTFQLKAVNSAGLVSTSWSNSITATPSTTPDAPTSLVATPGNTSISVSFTPGVDGGYPITNYLYSTSTSTDNGQTFSAFSAFTAFSPAKPDSPVTITNLTNGNYYIVQLKAVDSQLVESAASASSNSAKPSTTPGAPTSLSATPGNTSITLSFTAPADTGGADITSYWYSLNGGSFIDANTISTTFTISGLANGTLYTIILKAKNVNTALGAASDPVSATPGTPPAPTSLSATTGNQSISISFTQSSTGAAAIINYRYSLDNGSTFNAFSPAQTTSPVSITGLTNGTSYTIRLKAENVYGLSVASASITATPSTVPDAPTSLSATATGPTTVRVNFTNGSNGGAVISNYWYSLNGGVYIQNTAPLPRERNFLIITGLTTGTSYIIRLKAQNINGLSVASTPSNSATPSTVPDAPTNLIAAYGGIGAAQIYFTAGFNQGSPIINYQYSIDGGTFTAFDPVYTASPVTITGLLSDTSYTFRLKAENQIGTSAASSSVGYTEYTPADPPTNLSWTDNLNGVITVYFTPGYDQGFAITNYAYSLDGGTTYTVLNPPQTGTRSMISTTTLNPLVVGSGSIIIDGLEHRTDYSIVLRGINSEGVGSPSEPFNIFYLCFLEGTKILCFNPDTQREEYRKIETLRKGSLVKTVADGYKPIDMIGTSKIYNPGNSARSKNRLYKCTKENYPELMEDLFITGCHSILVKDISEEERAELMDYQGKIYVTDDHYRLIAAVDKRAEPHASEGLFNIWHLALENENYYFNYGIYANGLLVETTSLRMMKELSGMNLV